MFKDLILGQVYIKHQSDNNACPGVLKSKCWKFLLACDAISYSLLWSHNKSYDMSETVLTIMLFTFSTKYAFVFALSHCFLILLISNCSAVYQFCSYSPCHETDANIQTMRVVVTQSLRSR